VVVAEVVIIGAGVAGLGAALGLDVHGHAVTVVEQDPPPPTTAGDAAFELWTRRSVPQFRQAHGFSARSRSLLLKYAPGVVERLAVDGITDANAFKMVAPPEIHEPDDEAFTGFMTRRPAFELALRLEAEDRPHIRFECPATVAGLLFVDHGPTPVVTGVRLADGRVLDADVVVDAAGRRSRVSGWVEEAGGMVSESVEDCGITYFTRYFRRMENSPLPIPAVFGIATRAEHLLVLGFAGDHDTYAITMAAAAWDDDLRELRHDRAWDAVAASLPVVAPWAARDNASPLGPVGTMTGHRNVLRHYMPNGEPAVLGILSVGDSLCTTNPAYGWGASMALTYAFTASEAINAGAEDLSSLANRYHTAVGPEAEGVYAESAASDRVRNYRWRNDPVPAEDHDEAERQSLIEEGILPGIMRDPVLARAFLRRVNLVEPPGALLENPDVLTHARARREKARARATTSPSVTRENIISAIAAARP
jgi:2-polyprenyl-6-methoxyphenol hydroxylase-like FAD-dependent oxidoreductase